MFRDGVVLVHPHGSSVLPHEQVNQAHVDSLLRHWSKGGAVQETPITVLVVGAQRLPGPLIVADGHHRLAAAQTLAARQGARIVLAARFLSLAEHAALILPAHRVIRQAPAGWVESCRARLHKRFRAAGDGSLGLATARHGALERFEAGGMNALEQLRQLHQLISLRDCSWSIEGNEGQALAELAAGRAEAVILTPALTIDHVLNAAHSGQLLPPRSTNFQPKPPEASIRFPLTVGSVLPAAANAGSRAKGRGRK